MSSFELMDPHRLRDAGAGPMSNLLAVSGGREPVWSPEDFGAVLRHQLRTALREDLGPLGPDAVRFPETFADLLCHSDPPPELLERVKRFAKAQREAADAALPAEVATLLYYAVVAAALVRLGRRITTMDDGALRAGFGWGSAQPWIDEPTRSLLREGQRSVDAHPRRGST